MRHLFVLNPPAELMRFARKWTEKRFVSVKETSEAMQLKVVEVNSFHKIISMENNLPLTITHAHLAEQYSSLVTR